jgi:hypothetical protein
MLSILELRHIIESAFIPSPANVGLSNWVRPNLLSGILADRASGHRHFYLLPDWELGYHQAHR